jgi:hypothetical protein
MIRLTILVGLLAVSALGATSGSVAAKSSDLIVRGDCSAASDFKLKVGREDGRLEVEFQVDQNRNHRLWKVSLSQNSTKVWHGSRYTRAPSGSFTVRKLLVNRAGADRIVAKAINVKTGEVCRGVISAKF